jgi:UDP-N-acetylglucosamine transferase subunit ALG13
VTLGTLPGWEFRRLVDACQRVIPANSEVLWQTGATDVTGLGIEARESISATELEQATASADVVISHAGVGSALTALRCGKRPILVPRQAAFGEHVDDHQRQIAAELEGRGLALVRTPDTLTSADLENVRNVGVSVPTTLPPIDLETHARPTLTSLWRRTA